MNYLKQIIRMRVEHFVKMCWATRNVYGDECIGDKKYIVFSFVGSLFSRYLSTVIIIVINNVLSLFPPLIFQNVAVC